MTSNGNGHRPLYLYTRFERFWHWAQAALIIALAVTGMEIHGSYTWLGFKKALEEPVAAFFMHPVDIALVSSATVAALRWTWSSGRQKVLYPCHAGRRGHPPLIDGELIAEILAWPGQGGLKALLRSHEPAAAQVEVPDPYILRDMDEPGDYQELAAAWRRHQGEEPK